MGVWSWGQARLTSGSGRSSQNGRAGTCPSTLEKQRFNKTVQHYRGRVEHLIGQVVDNRMALCTTWRGSITLLAAVMKIAAHMVGLQERMKGPRYDVFGPWPVCPPHIAAQFP